DVAVFQQGKDTIPSVGERQRKLLAPPCLLTGVHGLSYPVGGGESATDGPADPLVRVIESCRDLDKVEHGVLDPGTRWQHGRMRSPQDRVRPVDDDARNLHSRRMLSCWNRDRNE